MRSFLAVAAITLVGFVAGGAAGMWYESRRPLPPPPAHLWAEFHGGGPGGLHHGPVNRQELVARIEAIKPQLDAYQKRLDAIQAEFNRDLDTVLTSAQREQHAEQMKMRHWPRPGEHRPPGLGHGDHGAPGSDRGPLSDDDISRLMWEQPTRMVLNEVVIPFELDMLTRIYGLDDAQQEKVRQLLIKRRGAFLELVDSSPPPSVILSRTAMWIERLKEPPPPPPSGGPPPGP